MVFVSRTKNINGRTLKCVVVVFFSLVRKNSCIIIRMVTFSFNFTLNDYFKKLSILLYFMVSKYQICKTSLIESKPLE